MRSPLHLWVLLVRRTIVGVLRKAVDERDRLLSFLWKTVGFRHRDKRQARLVREFRAGSPLLPNDKAVAVALTQPFVRGSGVAIPSTPNFSDLHLVDGRH